MGSVAVMWLLAGCLVPNEDFDGPSSTTTAASSESSSSGLDTTTDGAADATGFVGSCEMSVEPTAVGCPAECTGGCQNGTCVIECGGASSCEGQTLICPPDLGCSVRCTGAASCRESTILCPAQEECSVDCVGEAACARSQVQCAAGSCRMWCSASSQVCAEAQVVCGTKDTEVVCDGPAPTLSLLPHSTSMCDCQALECDDAG